MPNVNRALRVAERHLSRVDARLAEVIRQIGPCTLKPSRASPYESLVRAVAYQQITARAGDAILARFLALYRGKRFPSPDMLFSTPVRTLRRVGFSRNKAKAIHDIAAHAMRAVVPTRAQAHRIDDETLIQRLLPIYGVGRWTVEMLLIFTLGRLDVLPVDDYGVQLGIQSLFRCRQKPNKKRTTQLTDAWRPYRSIGTWYLWRYVELKKKS